MNQDAFSLALETIRRKHFARPPASLEDLQAAEARGVPEPLLHVYRQMNGAFLCSGEDFRAPNGQQFRFRIPACTEIRMVWDNGYCCRKSPLESRLKQWPAFLDDCDGNWVALSEADDGHRVIDIFHETAGEPGSHKVISPDLATFLMLLLKSNQAFWLDSPSTGKAEWI